MRKLLLHIGHEKTGSSYIQSCLALSRDLLTDCGILYPWHPGLEGARLGRISSGNGDLILHPPIIPPRNIPGKILLSGEMLFHQLQRDAEWKQFLRFCRKLRVEEISVLLFTRNPVEHAASMYQQSIKRHGSTSTSTQFFETYDYPVSVANLLHRLTADESLHVTTRNYSHRKRSLISAVEQWLDIAPDSLDRPPNAAVNRSLTLSEIKIQIEVNRVLGRDGRVVADALCNRHPDVAAEMPLPAKGVQEAMLSRLAPSLNEVNAFCRKEDHYNRETLPPSEGPFASLSQEQAITIATSLAEAIGNARAPGFVKRVRTYNRGLQHLRIRYLPRLDAHPGRAVQK